ncbi:hypothetical protein V7S43_003553 [Phytophthora oleae]|uniref:Uncharacterized protein n=1 Tax=Phytophthora oleae TaxID=2107226 RepID=A0ABD3FXI7_9STRA
MGKEELLDALAGVQTGTSVEVLRASFMVVHEAVSDIYRKRWRFFEDACSVVLRQVFRLVPSGEDEEMDPLDSRTYLISTLEGVTLCLEFIEPLSRLTTTSIDAPDGQEAANQRGVLLAALLYLFSKVPRNSPLQTQLAAQVLQCGVGINVILATLRFREELVECRRALIPSYESDSDVDSDDDEIQEDRKEFEDEDVQWITEQVAKEWGLTRYRYFLQTSGQEYTFSAWSYRGIGNFVHTLLTTEQQGVDTLQVVVSPFSWLFHLAAYAHYMIHSEDHQERLQGLELLRAAVALCPQGKLGHRVNYLKSDEPQSFGEQVASFRDRDWVSPLIQVITNAMVSFPETKDRSLALVSLKELTSKLAVDDRFWLLRGLIIKCPYGNVAAVLVDFIRGDAVQAWSSSEVNPQTPFKTTEICSLLQDALSQAAERDLVLHADLIASCLSLIRFLFIRDKDNSTGIRSKMADHGVWSVLARINKRLQVKVEVSASGQSGEPGPHSVDMDITHLMILEASLTSTLELCN